VCSCAQSVWLVASRRVRALMITSQRPSIWSSVSGGSASTAARMAARWVSVSVPVGGVWRLAGAVVGLASSFLAVLSARVWWRWRVVVCHLLSAGRRPAPSGGWPALWQLECGGYVP
jgi:hypothetical protein